MSLLIALANVLAVVWSGGTLALLAQNRSVASNAFATDALDPPTGLSASDGTSIILNWTITPDSYASGHRVLRGTTSGGPYSQIAEATPRTTSTYTDSPASGRYYYVARAFYQNWESANSNEASAATCPNGDTGYRSPTAQAADTGGDGNGFELNPTNAYADGAGYASNINGAGDRHRFYNYNLSIPAGCNISGIEVRLDWWLDSTSGASSMAAELSWNGGSSFTAAKSDTVEATVERTVVLGGPTDTWGRGWSSPELSNANFRVRLSASSTASGRDFYLDWAPVKVYYGAP